MIIIKQGNLFNSNCKTLVNTINCSAAMGKGIALEFKQRYPNMYRNYVERCNQNLVRVGYPYLYHHAQSDRYVILFPTKQHWRDGSQYQWLIDGLKYLVNRINENLWPELTSIAFPPLGCGNGGLDWQEVLPLMTEQLSKLNSDMLIEIYEPRIDYGT